MIGAKISNKHLPKFIPSMWPDLSFEGCVPKHTNSAEIWGSFEDSVQFSSSQFSHAVLKKENWSCHTTLNYQSVQLGSITSYESILAALGQIKVIMGARERQQQDPHPQHHPPKKERKKETALQVVAPDLLGPHQSWQIFFQLCFLLLSFSLSSSLLSGHQYD